VLREKIQFAFGQVELQTVATEGVDAKNELDANTEVCKVYYSCLERTQWAASYGCAIN